MLRDGRAIVVIRGPLEREDYPSLDIVLGWGDELKRKLASGAAR